MNGRRARGHAVGSIHVNPTAHRPLRTVDRKINFRARDLAEHFHQIAHIPLPKHLLFLSPIITFTFFCNNHHNRLPKPNLQYLHDYMGPTRSETYSFSFFSSSPTLSSSSRLPTPSSFRCPPFSLSSLLFPPPAPDS